MLLLYGAEIFQNASPPAVPHRGYASLPNVPHRGSYYYEQRRLQDLDRIQNELFQREFNKLMSSSVRLHDFLESNRMSDPMCTDFISRYPLRKDQREFILELCNKHSLVDELLFSGGHTKQRLDTMFKAERKS